MRPLGSRQIELLRLMSTSHGGTLPYRYGKRRTDLPVVASLVRRGLVEDDSYPGGTPSWRITTDGRIAAEKAREGKPELCYCCDKRPAVYVRFSGAQSGQEFGYPSASLMCEQCYDDGRASRTYRLVPVEAA